MCNCKVVFFFKVISLVQVYLQFYAEKKRYSGVNHKGRNECNLENLHCLLPLNDSLNIQSKILIVSQIAQANN